MEKTPNSAKDQIFNLEVRRRVWDWGMEGEFSNLSPLKYERTFENFFRIQGFM